MHDPNHIESETGTPERTISIDGEVVSTCEEEEKKKPAKVKKFPVVELFGPVIQGEGTQAGQQTMFVRFGGCDFRCDMCDSLHAVEPQAIQKHATYMEAEEIYTQLEDARTRTGVRWVTFSGGNPCMHKLDALVDLLLENNWYINVETQGSIYQEWLRKCTTVTVSPKPPGMGEAFNAEDFIDFLVKVGARPVCIKVPVFYEADLEMVLYIQDTVDIALEQMGFLPTDFVPYSYYLSLGNPYPPALSKTFDLVMKEPEGGLVNLLLHAYARMSEEVLQDKRLKRWRFLPQLHVLVYGNEAGR